ncbi:zinc finger protein 664 [Scaptodrosophila lebanonensis]|uniref:Zinc finger protein 664 n=1 Tax=Drosophila lebanonensis TaxID=7225 RepID=A0A6J2TSR2_DROLE|nr:zinc finger protein 664 [Scaptodrosophila lebanonensis]
MLKHCLLNVDYKQHIQPKCGEIFYENECNGFQLVCCLCGLKAFSFEDFVLHIRNGHFDSQGKPLTHTVTAKTTLQPNIPNAIGSQDQSCHPLIIANNNDDDNGPDFLPETEHVDDETQEADKPLRIMAVTELEQKTDESNTPWQECNDITTSSDSECEENTAEETDVLDAADTGEVEKQTVFKKHRLPKEYKCEYCTRNYTTVKYLNIHIKMSHPHPNAFKCDECEATFDVDRALESHRRKAHTEFTCKLCSKVYKSSRTLLRHVQGHSGLRQYKCDFENCGKSFVNQHNLSSHRRVHSTERNYVCELCGYRSRYREALIVHRRTHTGEKPFKCETCERCFASKSLLNEHQAMHSTERPYKCDKCEAAFSRPKALYHHKHLHLGIKKFKCKICGNAYAQAAGLSAHMRGHKMQASNGVADGGEISGMELLFSY